MKRILAFILTATFCFSLSACVNKPTDEATETSAQSVSETSVTTTEVTTEVTSVTEKTDVTEEPEKQSQEEEYGEMVEISPNNRFIDFDFIKDYKGAEVEQSIEEKAVQALMESDYYKYSNENKEPFYIEGKVKPEFAAYFDDEGNIVPKIQTACPEDYNGDGFDEVFIIVDMPCDYSAPAVGSFLLYGNRYTLNNGGDYFEIITNGGNLGSVDLLDYGECKQLILFFEGTCGNEFGCGIYGVVNEGAKALYGRDIGGFGNRIDWLVKTNCFLGSYGTQNNGGTIYYDTATQEYRYIIGKELNFDDIFKMDSNGVIKEYASQYSDFYENELYNVCLIGGKYYCFYYCFMPVGDIYTYENGEFTRFDESGYDTAIRYTGADEYSELNYVQNINIDTAYAEMLTPTEAKQAAYDKKLQNNLGQQ